MHEPEKNVTEELVDIRYAIYKQPGRARIISEITQVVAGGLLDPSWVEQYSNPDHLRGVRCPTLVAWTRHNPGLTAEHAAEAMKYIPNARMVIFENSAHWPQWEETERYNIESLKFLTTS